MGLLENNGQAQQGQQSLPSEQPEQKLNPQQQQQVDLGVSQATKFILEQENANRPADMAESGDPIQAMVEFALPVLRSIYTAAQDAGHELSPEVVASIGFNVAHVMATVLSLADVITPEEVESIAVEAYQTAIEKHNTAGSAQQSAPVAQGA